MVWSLGAAHSSHSGWQELQADPDRTVPAGQAHVKVPVDEPGDWNTLVILGEQARHAVLERGEAQVEQKGLQGRHEDPERAYPGAQAQV